MSSKPTEDRPSGLSLRGPPALRRAGARMPAAALLLAAALPAASLALDPFNTRSQVTQGPAAPMLDDAGDVCRQTPVSSPLLLLEAVERALCESPKTHIAWAAVKAAAAQVGESRSNYLPLIAGTAGYSTESVDTQLARKPELSTNFSQPVNTEGLQLTWLLYDFGGRAATLRASKELMAAAQAGQIMALQTAFAGTAKDYYAAQAGAAAVEAARRLESDAQQTLDAATARYKSGVAPVTDQLQANTLYAQAVFTRAKAEGAQRIAIGTLAVDMSLSPEERLRLPQLDESVLPNTDFVKSVHELIDAAIDTHPSVVAARSQWLAAVDGVRVAKALGLPKLSLSGALSRAEEPESATIGTPVYPAISHEKSIGITLEFPLFEGFSWTYKVHQAEALAESSEQTLHDTRQQVELTVWSTFQGLQSATENLRNTQIVLQSARDSFTAAEHRYQSGVGNILELTTAQNTLATAEQQEIQAQLDWRTARVQLAQSLGTLGLWAVK